MDKGRKTQNRQDKTVLQAVLKAFVPYTRENLMLAYKPGKFFSHLEYLEQQTGANRRTISSTISRAKRAGLLQVDKDGNVSTTWRGNMKLAIVPKKKTRHYLVIIFDVPESYRKKRDLFRRYLQSVRCEQVQKSVWKTRYDIYDELIEVVHDLELGTFASLFMADELHPNN